MVWVYIEDIDRSKIKNDDDSNITDKDQSSHMKPFCHLLCPGSDLWIASRGECMPRQV